MFILNHTQMWLLWTQLKNIVPLHATGRFTHFRECAMLISEHPVAIVKCRIVIKELILSFISVICRIVTHVYLHTYYMLLQAVPLLYVVSKSRVG